MNRGQVVLFISSALLGVGSSRADSATLDQSKAQLNRAYQQVYERSKSARSSAEQRAIRDQVLAPATRDLQVSLQRDAQEQIQRARVRAAPGAKRSQERLAKKFATRDPKHPGDPRAKSGPRPASTEESVKPTAPVYSEPAPVEALDGSGISRQIEFKKSHRPTSK